LHLNFRRCPYFKSIDILIGTIYIFQLFLFSSYLYISNPCLLQNIRHNILYVHILDLNIFQLLSNDEYIGDKMDAGGPSSFENSNWEEELDVCFDSDAS
jgi:hypothetical protein